MAHHNCHINSIFVYLFMPELFIDKICFCKFLSMSDKPRLNQLKIISSSPSSTVKAYLTAWMFSSVRKNTTKEGEIPYVENTKPQQLIKPSKISYSITSLVFRKFLYRTYRNGLNQGTQSWGTPSTAKSANPVSLIPFVAISHITILLQGCGTSKIYLCLEDNKSSFSWVSSKCETKDERP